MRQKATVVVLGILLGACGFEKEQFTGDAPPPPVEVGFYKETTLQDERAGDMLVQVSLSREALDPVEVNYAFTGGSALIDVDYTALDGTLSWTPGTTDQFIPLSIALDSVEEQDETIEITLSSPSNAMLDTKTRHTITISAKLLPRVNITTAVSDADEAGSITIEMTLDSPPDLESSATIAYRAVGTTALIGFDWAMPVNATVIFPVNTTTRSITVPVMNDSVDEDDENVVIEILSTTNVVIGTVFERTHTIHDNDNAPTVAITSAATASTMEGNTGTTNATITVSLSAPSGKLITVPVTYSGGTATEASDYTYLAKGDLVFMPHQNPGMSETSKTITIQVAGDTIDEEMQTIITTLGSTPTNVTLGAVTSQTQTIGDDDNPPSVVFTTANFTTNENDSGTPQTATYTLTLSAASERMIGFDIDLTGTATIPMDYSTDPAASSGTVRITINPPAAGALGATTATIDLLIVGDNSDEGNTDETIIMDIASSNLMNVSRGAMAGLRRTHSINDDD